MNSLKKTQTTGIKNTEESMRLLINKIVGNYLHDELSINDHSMTKVTNNCTVTYATFENKQLQLKQTCIHLEQTKD